MAGVEGIWRLLDRQHGDLGRRQGIQASGQGRRRIVRHVDAHDLMPGVDAGVGAPRNGWIDRGAEDTLKRSGELPFNSPLAGLSCQPANPVPS